MKNKIKIRITFVVCWLIVCAANLGYAKSLTYCVNKVQNEREMRAMGIEGYQAKKVYEGKGYVKYISTMDGKEIGESYNAKDDFVGELFQHPPIDFTNKEKFFSKLNKAVKAKGPDFEELVDAYNGIYYAPEAWDEDVIKWLEPRVDSLPAPFYMLLGYKYAKKDISKFITYFYTFRLQAGLDITCCKDKSVAAAGQYIDMLFAPEAYKKNQSLASDKDIDPAKMQAFFQELGKGDAVYRKAAREIFEKRKIKRSDSFWVYNHGMSHIGAVLKGKKESIGKEFLSLKEMELEKQSLISQWKAKWG